MRTPSFSHIRARRRRLVAAAALLCGAGLVHIQSAEASHPEASLPGSNFEIDVDANLKLDDPAPSTDWASIPQGTTPGTEIRATDKVNGTGDDSYSGGVKEAVSYTHLTLPTNREV